METITTWFSIVCAVVSVITIFIICGSTANGQ